MPFRRKILLTALGFILLLGLLSVLLPCSFSARGEIEIAAPVGTVFDTVADLTNHPLWNVRKGRDESMRFTFPEKIHSGKGAILEWTSKADIGRCTVVDSVKDKRIVIQVALSGRGSGGGETLWTFEKRDNRTRVFRSFNGRIDVPLIGPWVVLLAHPGERLTADFKQELVALKKIVEGAKTDR